MKNHTVKVYPSKQELKREDQLAWKIAAVASDPVEVDDDVTDMVIVRERAKARAADLVAEAEAALAPYGEKAHNLAALARYIIDRDR